MSNGPENSAGSVESPGTVESPTPSDDGLYRALARKPRRRLLYYLLDEDESTREELASVLVGWSATESGSVATPRDREQTLLALQHVHLPRLAETGMVSYDVESGRVALAPLSTPVEDLIRQAIEGEKRSPDDV